MSNNNKSMGLAKKAKNDEFYTRLNDISSEVYHYSSYFKDKVVFCNCDDPSTSNFFKYFVLNFNYLGLKKLITTSYSKTNACKAIINEVDDVMNDIEDVFKKENNSLERLAEDGDFRSDECLKLLDESDIVVTNPPFSLFREYVETLVKHDKKFLIIGNPNAITYKNIFPLFKNDMVWLGYKPLGSEMYFDVSDEYKKYLVENKKRGSAYQIVDGVVMGRIAVCWFTNLDTTKRHSKLIFTEQYDPERYPKYDTYDAIHVGKTLDIPKDYSGIMGVPITFMDKYNPEQFEIVGEANHGIDSEYDLFKPTLNGVLKFKRLLIRHKT